MSANRTPEPNLPPSEQVTADRAPALIDVFVESSMNRDHWVIYKAAESLKAKIREFLNSYCDETPREACVEAGVHPDAFGLRTLEKHANQTLDGMYSFEWVIGQFLGCDPYGDDPETPGDTDEAESDEPAVVASH